MNILLRAAGAAVLLTGLAVHADEPSSSTDPVALTSIHEVPGRTHQQLCTAARDWAAAALQGHRPAVEVFDPDAGQLIARGHVMVPSVAIGVSAGFSLRVECKEGRLRAIFDNVQATHQGLPIALIPGPPLRLREMAMGQLRVLDSKLDESLRRAAADW